MGLGILMFLQNWANRNGIPLKLFNPRLAVRASLERTEGVVDWQIASVEGVLELIREGAPTWRLPISDPLVSDPAFRADITSTRAA
jgi:hypothetical protein